MQRLELGHRDLYEPGTRRERAYMQGISSVYQTDSTEDATTITAATMQKGGGSRSVCPGRGL